MKCLECKNKMCVTDMMKSEKKCVTKVCKKTCNHIFDLFIVCGPIPKLFEIWIIKYFAK